MYRTTTSFLGILIISFICITPSSALAQRSYEGEYGFGNPWGTNNSALQQSIAALGNTPVANLPIPVLFGVSVKNLTKNFGDPRSGHSHEGLDIMAPEGAPIVSPTDAVVIQIGVWEGAGNFVTTAAPGNESFTYMHLSKVANIVQGDVLKPGDIVGYVGHTGNAIATAPHLHFEIRDANGVAYDPFPRITTAFEAQNKMIYLKAILDKPTTATDLSDFLVTAFRSEFISAKALGLTLPGQIEASLSKATTATPIVVAGSSTGTLKIGSRGPEVATLQRYLVVKNIGSAAKVVPDGAFGPITKAALIDFQKSAGLTPDGVYGPKSRAYSIAHP